MFTIWFASHGNKMHVDVAEISIARQLWDTLATQFDMLSARP
jgi:hypothetical protein